MRGTIAKRMRDSLQTMAQLTLTSEVDVTELAQRREGLGRGVSYTDVIVKAAALTLAAHPRLNATVSGEHILLLDAVHIGVAVAVDDGLVVPVIRDADRKPLRQIAEERRRLVERARAGEATPQELSGSTFTVTNLGSYGIDAFTPIINPPEAAILGVGRIVERAARRGADVVWRQVLVASLTIDHRVIDGAPAAAALQTLAAHLQDPSALLADTPGSART